MSRRNFVGRTGSAALGMGFAGLSAAGRAGAAGANDRIGIGVIGVGARGNTTMRGLHWLKGEGSRIEIVAVCDVYRPRMASAAEGYKAKGYRDHRELLADPNVDAVFITSPDHHHGQQSIDAIRAGKDVYCEKPITHWRQFDLLRQTVDVASRSDRVFQLGTQGMSDSAWSQMKKLVKQGLIGQPIHAECGYFRIGDWGERGMHVDDPNARPGPDLNWDAFVGDAPKRPFDVSRFFRWRMYEDYAGGPVTDLYPHSLTPLVSILDLKAPSVVTATGGKYRYQEREVPDTFNILIDYPQGLTVIVMGTQGNTFCNPDPTRRGAESKVPVIRGWEGTLTVRGKEIVFTPIIESRDDPAKEQRFAIERDQNHIDHLQNFLECCRNRRKETNSPPELAYYTQLPLIMSMWAHRQSKVARYDAGKREILL